MTRAVCCHAQSLGEPILHLGALNSYVSSIMHSASKEMGLLIAAPRQVRKCATSNPLGRAVYVIPINMMFLNFLVTLQQSSGHLVDDSKTTGVSGFAFQGTNAHVILRSQQAMQLCASRGGDLGEPQC